MPDSSSLPPRRRRPRKVFPPCIACGEDSGFTWACECGFALCHGCMAQNLERTKNNGRNWVCPDCRQGHVGPNR
ncbi:MAG: hypothetical protein PVF51_09650 [Nitrospirota bacterium]